jgi:hypothetical protein
MYDHVVLSEMNKNKINSITINIHLYSLFFKNGCDSCFMSFKQAVQRIENVCLIGRLIDTLIFVLITR